jgi:glycine/serine hydroxymethyltransferase
MAIFAKKSESKDVFFSSTIKETDNELYSAISGELKRQQNQIELIAL